MKKYTSFVEVFGTSPLIRVLDFLITYREFDYSLTDIAKETEVGWNTLHSFFPKLVEINSLITSRAVDEEVRKQKIEIET